YQFERTEWWPPERLRRHQFEQLRTLLAHAAAEVAFYRERLGAAGFRPDTELTEEIWRRIPILTRAEVQAHRDALQSNRVPQFHGKTDVQFSSGSTGTPVAVTTTELRQLIWEALTLRDNLWHRRDMTGTLAALRGRAKEAGAGSDGLIAPVWSLGVGAAFHC